MYMIGHDVERRVRMLENRIRRPAIDDVEIRNEKTYNTDLPHSLLMR